MSSSEPSNWQVITPSPFPWEQAALDYIRSQFPTHEPYRAWAGFEFIGTDGSINQIDLLVFTPQGFFLVEIKSDPGALSGDTHSWIWRHDGRTYVKDNPVFLTNEKAKRLSSLLARQSAFKDLRVPFVEPLIFCSAENLVCQLQGDSRFYVCLRDLPDQPGILAALKRRECPGLTPQLRGTFNRPVVKAVSRALDQAGIRPSQRGRRVGDYELQGLLDDGPGYQDFLGKHVALNDTLRRIRIYLVKAGSSAEQRTMVQRAAEREFRLLEFLEHPGVLRALDMTSHEMGPAIIFQHIPGAVRLDHYLIEHKQQISDDLRLSLLRQLAETVKFAHGKHIVHRALSPRNILVTNPESKEPRTAIMNWQLGYRQSVGDADPITRQVTATIHVDAMAEEPARLYMAPEAVTDADNLGEHHDIFSLGAIGYRLFTGEDPASSSLALAEKLRTQRGLRVSAVLNGAPESLDQLIQYSTDPDVSDRLDSVDEFLQGLEKIEDALTTPEEMVTGEPTQAKPGELLPGGYRVIRKLGTGSSASAFLVEKDTRQVVLKIAIDTAHNDRVRDEGEVLQKLNSPLIVRCHGIAEVGDRTAVLLDYAGDTTLGKRIRDEGRLSLDLLQRFGTDLLEAVVLLEKSGIAHRDIKPENIGVSAVGRRDALHLVLFDFSLSRCPYDNIRAGTPGFLDPFLSLRKPQRWDLQAERFAAGVTLYQMATGLLPIWHDGKTLPDMVECEATMDPERYEPNYREPLTDFFQRALRRNPKERFDNAQEMQEAWRKIFATLTAEQATTSEEAADDQSARLLAATGDTNVAELGLGAAAADALDRINVVKVGDLITVQGRRLARLRGVGNKTRKHILAAAKVLRDRLGVAPMTVESMTQGADDSQPVDSQIPPDKLSIDLLAQGILRAKAKVRNATENAALEGLLGLDPRLPQTWPSQVDVAPLASVTRGRISQILSDALTRWKKNPGVTSVRDQIAALVEQNGGMMSAAEVSEALLAARGSVEDEPRRSRLANAVTRAAAETENTLEEPKFFIKRTDDHAVLAVTPSQADYAADLGQVADDIAKQDPLVSPLRVLELLRAVSVPPETEPLGDVRLVRLAVAASQKAALSSKQEVYPRDMDAARALRLSHGTLVGARQLTPTQVGQRVSSRYPQAALLPHRPQLDQLLRDAGLELIWNADAPGGGAYVSTVRGVFTVTDASSTLSRLSTGPAGTTVTVQPEVAEARQFEDRLRYAERHGAYLALTVKQNLYTRAQDELTRRFATHPLDLERVFVQALHQAATEVKADWTVVLNADAADPRSADWRNLNRMIASHVMPKVEEAVNNAGLTVLLTHVNWLPRYGQIELLTRLHTAVQEGRIHGVWLLLPARTQTPMPMLDNTAVPVITSNQWAEIPESWCQNAHRAGIKAE